MIRTVVCEGAPRDLGRDQGTACAAPLRRGFAALPRRERWRLRLGRRGLQDRRLARDLARHFPHQFEALRALAAAARVPEAWLLRGLLETAPGAEAAAAAALAGRRALVARSADEEGVLRRSRPEGRFRSVELARPGAPAALAGLNERGLAVAVVGEPGLSGSCAAPGLLLAQDCLGRFESLDASLAWCRARPGGGRAWLLLADAAGELAALRISGDERRVARPAEGVLGVGAAGAAAAELAKRLRRPGAEPGAALGEAVAPRARALLLDPGARRLALGGESFSP